MKSSGTKIRTASTAVQSKAKLPKITISAHHESVQAVNKKLFSSDNRSILLTSHRSSNKTTFRERMRTEISSSRRLPLELRHQRVEDMGMKRLEQCLENINRMFKDIQRLRQSYGIVSVNEHGEEEERYGPDSNQIPYDPHLHEMNEQIFQIKCQIQEALEEVFRISKQYPRLKHLIERLLEQHMQEFLVENGRNGKIAAMKAHHRLIQSSQEKLTRLCKF